MNKNEKIPGGMNRYPGYACLTLSIILSVLTLAVLFGSLTPSHAAPHPATRAIESETMPQSQPTSTVTLLVATNAEFPPMEYYSGTQIVGHDIDLMNAIALEMGVTVVYTDVTFEGIVDGLVSGQYDAIVSTLSINPDREELIDFTLPYVNFGGTDNIAIGVQQGDDTLRAEINNALRQLRADGTLDTIIAAIAADQPDWQPALPEWPAVYLPVMIRNSGE